jgi:glycosyltransferase involved in cell wall biosynthesis
MGTEVERAGAAPAEIVHVTCILPTRNRAAYIPQAIHSYQSQTYPHRDLLIVDNGNDGTEALIPADPTISYVRLSGMHSTGEMRNQCNERAQGSVICHFDSDDWSAPGRVTDQVTRLGVYGVLTGYSAMFFYDDRDGQCYWWSTPRTRALFALGTSLCYRREWWRQHPFLPLKIGKDYRFVQTVLHTAPSHFSHTSAEALMVARVHNDQTSRKTLQRPRYQPVNRNSLPKLFCAL